MNARLYDIDPIESSERSRRKSELFTKQIAALHELRDGLAELDAIDRAEDRERYWRAVGVLIARVEILLEVMS